MTAAIPTESPEGAEQADSRARVLLVDDDQDTLEDYAELFTLMGVPVLTQACPITAASMVLGDPLIRVVVADVKMEAMDGLSLIAHVRGALPADRQVHFILLTGYDVESIGSQVPGVPVFTKPADFEQLIRHVKQVLAN